MYMPLSVHTQDAYFVSTISTLFIVMWSKYYFNETRPWRFSFDDKHSFTVRDVRPSLEVQCYKWIAPVDAHTEGTGLK